MIFKQHADFDSDSDEPAQGRAAGPGRRRGRHRHGDRPLPGGRGPPGHRPGAPGRPGGPPTGTRTPSRRRIARTGRRPLARDPDHDIISICVAAESAWQAQARPAPRAPGPARWPGYGPESPGPRARRRPPAADGAGPCGAARRTNTIVR
jgi:hypothetical protein